MCWAVLALLALEAAAFNSAAKADESLYLEEIKPLLRQRCYACHGALAQESGLRLDTAAAIRHGGDSGAIIDVDSPADSILLERITASEEERMPPEGMPLTSEEVENISRWIREGAAAPADEAQEQDPQEHWSFRTIERPAPPDVRDPSWPRNDIDRFIRRRHEQLSLRTAPDATPGHQLRRLHLDLTGLPPTVEQLNAFLADPSDEHYERVVEQLLQSPHYGERWARHWMDVWRYSDWYGRRQQNDVRNSAPQIWRWRDWIINSLNDDKGYDQMVAEMLAADEVAADDDQAWPATGYLIRNYYSLNPNEWMRHNVEYTGKAFLGLTFNCAHCHDHKYDPIKQDDYFRLRAFFEPIGVRQDRVLGEPEPPPFEPYTYAGSRKVVRLGMVRVFDEKPEAPTWFYSGGDERNRDENRGSINPGVPEFLDDWFEPAQRIPLPTVAWYPGARPHIRGQVRNELLADWNDAKAQVKKATAQPIDTTAADKELANTREAFEKARRNAKRSGALSGEQSLLMSAPTGRRILQNDLVGMKQLTQDAEFQFRVRVLTEGNFNFQLARDAKKHLTALYLGFVNGQVMAYQPGGFNEFALATYAAAPDSPTIDVRLQLDPARDVALATLRVVETGAVLADKHPIALNGWNPAKNPNQPFTFDCREGTRALLDDVRFQTGEQTYQWDFESPRFSDGQDVSGIAGWRLHDASRSPADSIISMVAGDPALLSAYDAWQTAKAARESLTLSLTAAEARSDAAAKALDAFETMIRADDAREDQRSKGWIKKISTKAKTLQLEAAAAKAKADRLDAQVALGGADKAKIAAARKTLAAAEASFVKADNLLKDHLAKPTAEYKRLSPVTAWTSTGRRSALAAWMTDRRNPLTARVAVNHIWMRHLGQPLVASVYDFGRNGEPPTHPELLDWLAMELIENNWSMKHLHRLIVTSRTYRMSSSSRGCEESLRRDKDNRLLWRRPRLRMESEVVRDSLLAISGKLDRTIGGPVIANTQVMKSDRRSIYFEVYPEDGGATPMAQLFDAPSPTECFRRTTTIVPQQALALSNSKLIHASCDKATTAFTSALPQPADDQAFAEHAFRAILARPPTERERDATLAFINGLRKRKIANDQIRRSVTRVLFNHNDFVTIR